MRNFLFYIALLYSSITIAQTAPVKAEINRDSIRIGEQFEYKLSVDASEDVILPKLQLQGIEVIDSLKLDTLKNKLVQKYILTGFDSGAYYIPQQQIFIRNQSYLTDSLLIKVATVAIDTTKIQKFPIKGIKGEPYQFDDYKNILYLVIGILLIVSTVLYFALKRTKDNVVKTSEQLLNPYQEALRNLKLLDDKLLWQNNKVKEYYSELTNILRHFIERELHIPALETTTNGLINSLIDFKDSESILTDKETIQRLEKLLQQADLVKFAKSKPLAHEIEGDRNVAKHILDNLKPNIIENETDTAITPVIIVEKPTVKKPSILVKIAVVLVLLSIIGLLSYSVSKIISYSNSSKAPISNVK